MKLKNVEIMDCIRLLDNHLNRKDLIGYAVARNIRNLRNNIIEYEQTYNNSTVSPKELFHEDAS